MALWMVFLLVLLVILVYLLLQKIHNDYKFKHGRQALAGKVIVSLFLCVSMII